MPTGVAIQRLSRKSAAHGTHVQRAGGRCGEETSPWRRRSTALNPRQPPANHNVPEGILAHGGDLARRCAKTLSRGTGGFRHPSVAIQILPSWSAVMCSTVGSTIRERLKNRCPSKRNTPAARSRDPQHTRLVFEHPGARRHSRRSTARQPRARAIRPLHFMSPLPPHPDATACGRVRLDKQSRWAH